MNGKAEAGRLADTIEHYVYSDDIPQALLAITSTLRAYAAQDQRTEAATSAEGAKGDGGTGCQLTIPEAQSSAHQSTAAQELPAAAERKQNAEGQSAEQAEQPMELSDQSTSAQQQAHAVDHEIEPMPDWFGSRPNSPESVASQGIDIPQPSAEAQASLSLPASAAPLPEKVQREIDKLCSEFGGVPDIFRIEIERIARLAIASAVPEGYVVVDRAYLHNLRNSVRRVPEDCVVVPLSLVERTEDFLRATYPAGNLVRDWTMLLAAAKERANVDKD